MRYTFMGDGYAAVNNDVCYEDQNEDYCGAAIDKLAAYENTGYSPLDIKSLEGEWNAMRVVVDSYRRLEEQGLLVRMPCKVGDTLYAPTRNFVSEFRVSQFDFGGYEKPYLWVEWHLTKGITGNFRIDGIPASEIGKTVFLTREEAEAAMEGGQDDAGNA